MHEHARSGGTEGSLRLGNITLLSGRMRIHFGLSFSGVKALRLPLADILTSKVHPALDEPS